jgi:hypothetical protein
LEIWDTLTRERAAKPDCQATIAVHFTFWDPKSCGSENCIVYSPPHNFRHMSISGDGPRHCPGNTTMARTVMKFRTEWKNGAVLDDFG